MEDCVLRMTNVTQRIVGMEYVQEEEQGKVVFLIKTVVSGYSAKNRYSGLIDLFARP